jgi:hypothetical protein
LDLFYKTLEPYIAEDINILDAVDLKNAYLGYSHQHLSESLKLKENIE